MEMPEIILIKWSVYIYNIICDVTASECHLLSRDALRSIPNLINKVRCYAQKQLCHGGLCDM